MFVITYKTNQVCKIIIYYDFFLFRFVYFSKFNLYIVLFIIILILFLYVFA